MKTRLELHIQYGLCGMKSDVHKGVGCMQHICAGPSLPFVCGREGQADSPDIPWNTMYRI